MAERHIPDTTVGVDSVQNLKGGRGTGQVDNTLQRSMRLSKRLRGVGG